ncbi:hypothetical protein BSM4216_1033 [Bacillus smithii]|nr:hypothetical protein BSM4216_1033 [Bacillus smithii]
MKKNTKRESNLVHKKEKRTVLLLENGFQWRTVLFVIA